MAGFLVNQGEEVALLALVNKTAPQNLTLRLYSNNYVIVETTTEGDVTEATGNGYASIALTAATWTVTPGAPTDAAYPEQVFAFTGALGNVYGYYLTQDISSKLIIAERFTDGPYNVQNNGDEIKVTLSITLD